MLRWEGEDGRLRESRECMGMFLDNGRGAACLPSTDVQTSPAALNSIRAGKSHGCTVRQGGCRTAGIRKGRKEGAVRF